MMKMGRGTHGVALLVCFLLFGIVVAGQTRKKQKPTAKTQTQAVPATSDTNRNDVINVQDDIGATGDGTTDDTAAIARAIDMAKAEGRPLYIPAGTYRVRQLLLSDNLVLTGDGRTRTTIKAIGANRPIVEVGNSGSRIVLRDMQILGTATAENAAALSEQHGFYQKGAVVSGIELNNVLIKNVGGNGVKLENAFSTTLISVETDFTYRDAFDISSAGPNLTLINSYVHSLGSPNGVAYRLRSGRPTLINANGVDGPQTKDSNVTWAIVGQSISSGDPTDSAAFPTFINPNVEAFAAFGILHREASTSNIIGGQFAPLGTATNVEPIRFNGGALMRGLLDSTTVFAGSRTQYRNGREIRSYGPAPLAILGPVGAYQGFDQGVTDYFNFETNTIEPLRRLDDWLTRKQVNGSYTMLTNETRLIDVRHTGPVTITLLSAARAGDGASVTVKDGAGVAGRYRILITAAEGKLDGAPTQAISTNYGAVTFYSDGRDWYALRQTVETGPPVPVRPVLGGQSRRNVIFRATGAFPLDFNTGNLQHLMLSGNLRVTDVLNVRDGGSYTIFVQQDATGGRRVTWPSLLKFPGGTPPALTLTANARDVIRCDSDGLNLYCHADLDVR